MTSIEYIEDQLRRVFGTIRCNNYRRLYRQAQNEQDRRQAIKGMADWAQSRYDCSVQAACAAVQRIITEPVQSERICDRCRWYRSVVDLMGICKQPLRTLPDGCQPQVGLNAACERFEPDQPTVKNPTPKIQRMKLTFAFPVKGGVADVEVLLDMDWIKTVALRAVGNRKRRSQHAFASARVAATRKYKSNPGNLDLDVALIVAAYSAQQGHDLDTLRKICEDKDNLKGVKNSLVHEGPDGFCFPYFPHETVERAVHLLMTASKEELAAYRDLAAGVDYE